MEEIKYYLSGKVMQSFIKRDNSKDALEQQGIYDWADSREDEGEGDSFMKHKEVQFDGKSRRQ